MLRRHNGELQDDLEERFVADDDWLDAEIDASFPASDPLSHWAGPRLREHDDDRSPGPVVHRRSVEDAPGRQYPEEPQPGR